MPDEVPIWCHWRAGRSPLLLVAPHGGRRGDGPRRRGYKVNDLDTAVYVKTAAAPTSSDALLVPWLAVSDQKKIFPEGVTFSKPEQQVPIKQLLPLNSPPSCPHLVNPVHLQSSGHG